MKRMKGKYHSLVAIASAAVDTDIAVIVEGAWVLRCDASPLG